MKNQRIMLALVENIRAGRTVFVENEYLDEFRSYLDTLHEPICGGAAFPKDTPLHEAGQYFYMA